MTFEGNSVLPAASISEGTRPGGQQPQALAHPGFHEQFKAAPENKRNVHLVSRVLQMCKINPHKSLSGAC